MSEVEEESAEANRGKVSWVLNKGLGIGKKVVVAGMIISSAPFVLPPLVVISAIGFACCVPSGVALASYACSEKLMNKLLPCSAPPLSLEDGTLVSDDVEESGYEGDVGESLDMEEKPVSKNKIEGLSEDALYGLALNVTDYDDGIGVTTVVIEDGEDQERASDFADKISSLGLENPTGIMGGGVRELPKECEDMQEHQEMKSFNDANAFSVDSKTIGDVGSVSESKKADNRFEAEKRTGKGKKVENKLQAEKLIGESKKVDKKLGAEKQIWESKKVDDKLEAEKQMGESKKVVNKLETKKPMGESKKVESKLKAEKPISEAEIPLSDTRNLRHSRSNTAEDKQQISIIKEEILQGERAEDNINQSDVQAIREKELVISSNAGGDIAQVQQDSHASNETSKDESTDAEISTGKDSITHLNGVPYDEAKIWAQIDAMRSIVGYKGTPHATCLEEVKALYLFTGVEPPASFHDPSLDLAQVHDKLRFLMSIIGVKVG